MIKGLDIVTEDASRLAEEDPDAFAMLRRVGFGASDSSIILGVNPFPNGKVKDLIVQKQTDYVTEDEKRIGTLINVQKGRDLEPIIMSKFEKEYQKETYKPKAMYRIPDTPLTVNFDGVMELGGINIPVECKFVSYGGSKYFDASKAINSLLQADTLKPLGNEVNSIYLNERAKEAGVPIYYYTQVQQQLLALDAPFGFLAGLFDKDWKLRVFQIMADPLVQQELLDRAELYWKEVQHE